MPVVTFRNITENLLPEPDLRRLRAAPVTTALSGTRKRIDHPDGEDIFIGGYAGGTAYPYNVTIRNSVWQGAVTGDERIVVSHSAL